MASIKKKTKVQIEYKSEIKRIKSLITRATKRGYVFPENIIPKTLKTAKKMTPDILYAKARYYSPVSGKFISGTERRKQERSESSKKAAQTRKLRRQKGNKYAFDYSTEDIPNITDNVLMYIEELLVSWTPSPNWSNWYADYRRGLRNTMESILQGAISQEGRINVAKRINNHADEVITIATNVLLVSDDRESLELQLTRFSAILKGRPLSWEESRNLTELQEVEEDEDMPF